METIILASASPRRQELLQQIGVPYEVVKSDAEEVLDAVEGPRALAVENARRKALAVAERYPGRVVLGADTVVFQDGAVYGKPKDAEDARSMLRSFAGRRHDVVTGVAVVAKDGVCYTDATETKVFFDDLTDDEIAAQRINALTVGCAFEVTEFDELIAETVTLVQKPKHFVGKVGGANAGVRVEAVALCNVGEELFKIEGSHRQLFNGVGSDPDGSIQVAAGERHLHVCGFHLLDAQVNLGMLSAQRGKETRQQIGRYGREDAEAERTADASGFFCRHFFQPTRFTEGSARLFQNLFARRGGFDTCRGAFKKTESEFLLQFLQHRAERGLRDAAFIGGATKVAGALHCHQIFQLLKCHG